MVNMYSSINTSGQSGFPANREPDLVLFSLKPSRDQDKSNDMRYSPIGSAVLELLSNTHTNKQTSYCFSILDV